MSQANMSLTGKNYFTQPRWPLLAGLIVFVLVFTFTLSSALGNPLAVPPQRVVSINACTDQLLFKLARRDQIAALSIYAADPFYSIYAAEVRASGIPLIRGVAEEVLKLRPDLVLAGPWTSAATRERIARHNIPLIELAPAESIAATISAIKRAARILGREARGKALLQQISAALRPHALPPDTRRLSALQLQRRGFTSGAQTLTGELMQRFGLVNAAEKLGIKSIGAAPLETVLKARPDVLIVLENSSRVTDQGAALLSHSALNSAYPPERRIVLPGQLTACGGPALVEAANTLSREINRMRAE
ncbi:MAG: ABC transporter substrate-binding protein [Alphaproteobacteria bacterium]